MNYIGDSGLLSAVLLTISNNNIKIHKALNKTYFIFKTDRSVHLPSPSLQYL
jgi:hypothetical protein